MAKSLPWRNEATLEGRDVPSLETSSSVVQFTAGSSSSARETVLRRSPGYDERFIYQLFGLCCAVILTAFYDLRGSDKGVFGPLLRSQLTQPMRESLRTKVEGFFPTDSGLSYARDDVDRIYTPAKQGPFLPYPDQQEAEVEYRANSYSMDPFNAMEKLRFFTAYRDLVRANSLRSFGSPGDLKYIADLIPGRCAREVQEFYEIRKDSLEGSQSTAVTNAPKLVSKSVRRSHQTAFSSEDASEEASGVIGKAPRLDNKQSVIPAASQGTQKVAGSKLRSFDVGAKASRRNDRPKSVGLMPASDPISASKDQQSDRLATQDKATSSTRLEPATTLKDLGESAEIVSSRDAEAGAGTSHSTQVVGETTATTTSAGKVSSAYAKYLQPTPSWRPELREADYLGTGEAFDKNVALIMAGKQRLDRLLPKPVTNTKGRIARKPTPSSKTTARPASRGTQSSSKAKPKGPNQSPAAAGSPLGRSSERHPAVQQSMRRPQGQRDRVSEAVKAVNEVPPKKHDATEKTTTPAKPAELQRQQEMQNNTIPLNIIISDWPPLRPATDADDEAWENADDLVELMRNSRSSRLREHSSS